MRVLSIAEVLKLHARVVSQSGGSSGLRDPGALESSLAQPHQSFGDEELYPGIVEKAAALGFFLIANHPFVDGNKRIGHAALEVTLLLNGFELSASVDEQEEIIVAVASGKMAREAFTSWVEQHVHRIAKSAELLHPVKMKWRRLDIPGSESCELSSQPDGWQLRGIAVLEHEKQPCRLEYQIACDPMWITRSASIRGNVGARSIDVGIIRRADGIWLLNDEVVEGVTGCLDVDLNFSPSTNLLPIRRLNLSVGQKADMRAAWLRFPSFLLEPLDQSYKRTGERTYRYESAGGSFVADLDVSETGLPIRYGNLWTADAT